VITSNRSLPPDLAGRSSLLGNHDAGRLKDLLLRTPRRIDRLMQFTLRCPQVLFRSLGVSSHVVIVGRLDTFQFMDRFTHVLTNLFNVVPVMNPLGKSDSPNKR
jgi:hypothetical protein